MLRTYCLRVLQRESEPVGLPFSVVPARLSWFNSRGCLSKGELIAMDGASATMAEMEDRMDEQTDGEGGTAPETDGTSGDLSPIEPRRVVEAILFATDSPLPAAKIASILDVGDARDVRKHIAGLNEEYEARGMSFRIEEIAGGYQMLTMPIYNTWLSRLLRVRQETKLSPAAMETLAVVAYKQPVTRAEIESIRGVAAGEMLNRLREVNLVKIVGRAEDLGRPLLYGTTKRFLEVFGLGSLEDLPQVEALASGAKAKPGTQAAAAVASGVDEPEANDSESASMSSEGGPKLSLVDADDATSDDAERTVD